LEGGKRKGSAGVSASASAVKEKRRGKPQHQAPRAVAPDRGVKRKKREKGRKGRRQVDGKEIREKRGKGDSVSSPTLRSAKEAKRKKPGKSRSCRL